AKEEEDKQMGAIRASLPCFPSACPLLSWRSWRLGGSIYHVWILLAPRSTSRYNYVDSMIGFLEGRIMSTCVGTASARRPPVRCYFVCLALLVGCPTSAWCFGDDVAFRRHVINADSEFVAAAVFDVNKDGKLDIISGGYWYEAPTWKKHFLRNVEVRGG